MITVFLCELAVYGKGTFAYMLRRNRYIVLLQARHGARTLPKIAKSAVAAPAIFLLVGAAAPSPAR